MNGIVGLFGVGFKNE